MSERALRLVAHTRWEWSLFVAFFPGISITVCVTPLENSETRASHRAPERSTQLNKDQGAPAGIPATRLSEAETAEQWHVEKKQENCTSPSKNPNTEVLTWQKESEDARGNLRQQHHSLKNPSLPSSAGPGSTCSSENNLLKIWIFMGIMPFQSLTQVLTCKWLWRSQIKIFHILMWCKKTVNRSRALHIKSWHRMSVHCPSTAPHIKPWHRMSVHCPGILQTKPSKPSLGEQCHPCLLIVLVGC